MRFLSTLLAAMPRRTLQKWFPHSEHFKHHPSLKRFGKGLHEPGLWHLNRRSVARAFAIGLFVAMLPIPFQMVVAALLAIILTANLPISVALVWLTNPATMPLIFYGSYWVGANLLGGNVISFEVLQGKGLFKKLLFDLYGTMFLGGVFIGLVLSVTGYWAMNALYHWQLHSSRRRRDRKRHLRRSLWRGKTMEDTQE